MDNLVIINHKLGRNMWRNADGHLYPPSADRACIAVMQSVLAQATHTRVKIVYFDEETGQRIEQTGWLCVNQASWRVGVSHSKGAKKAIEPLKNLHVVAIYMGEAQIYPA